MTDGDSKTRIFKLDVGGGHVLNVEDHGARTGIPVILLHGGPGAGISRGQIESFDLSAFRVITFDQRGAGKSTPHASIEGNTTSALIADIESIPSHFNIDRWLVAGGSWGSCLALAYGQAHPETRYKNDKVKDLVAAARLETDPAKREAMYVELQKMAKADLNWIDLYYSPYINVMRKNVSNFYQNPLGRFFLEDTVKN